MCIACVLLMHCNKGGGSSNKTIWTPSIGQLLQVSAEEHNTKDSCAVGLIH